MWVYITNVFSGRSLPLILAHVVCLLLVCNGPLMAQEARLPYHTLDPVVVTASRIPQRFSEIGQSVSVIRREEIEALPVDSVADLLQTVSGVDVRRRGAHGVQADVGIRGGSFEQTLILIDGINVSDPQTGHHSLDLPVNLEDIERIEVLKGPGARIYGHNAMAGVINIITRKVDQSAVGGYAKYGEYDYFDAGVHGALKVCNMSNRVSLTHRSSTGHVEEEDTDFDVKTFNYEGGMQIGKQEYRLGLGYADKDFGAYRFYSDVFPKQRERTETLLAHGSAHLEGTALEATPKIFWRRHNDDFKIEIGNTWQRNEHQTDTYGAQFDSRFDSELGETAFGCEIAFEILESSNLGNHDRQRSGVFVEHRVYPIERLMVGLGASAMRYSDWGWEYWPGAEVNLKLTEGFHWFASSGKSFRIPTYTELYYDTPANQGNPALEPESAWTYETGIRWRKQGVSANCSLFLRDEEDIIDWCRATQQEPWKTRNIAENTTRGVELGLDLYLNSLFGIDFVPAANIGYTYFDSDWDSGGFESKYILDHLRHQLLGSLVLYWFDTLTQAVKFRYEERMSGDSHAVVDTRFAYKSHRYEVFVDVTNLFDERYVESGFSPMPGRWVVAGVHVNMDL